MILPWLQNKLLLHVTDTAYRHCTMQWECPLASRRVHCVYIGPQSRIAGSFFSSVELLVGGARSMNGPFDSSTRAPIMHESMISV